MVQLYWLFQHFKQFEPISSSKIITYAIGLQISALAEPAGLHSSFHLAPGGASLDAFFFFFPFSVCLTPHPANSLISLPGSPSTFNHKPEIWEQVATEDRKLCKYLTVLLWI